MHIALRAPYTAFGALAEWAVALAPAGGGKKTASLVGRRGIIERFARWGAEHRDVSRPLVWLHAPSVGEGLQARPVIELLRRRHPEAQLVYTFYSPSAQRFALGVGADYADFLPFDTRGAARALLEVLQPTALVFSKLDVWPVLVDEAVRRGVRVGLIAATLTDASGRSGSFGRALLGDAYAALHRVGAIDADNAQRLTALGVRSDRICVTGDTRYDQVWERAAATDRHTAMLAPFDDARPTVVAGSTWPSDERVLESAWSAVRLAHPDVRLIIAPHEPTAAHLAPIEEWIRRQQWTGARLGADSASSADIVVVDRLGVLGDLYARADIAFVGGGFHAAGLHSVVEPAAFGAPVLFGPRFSASRDAAMLIEAQAGRAVDSARSLEEALLQWLRDDGARAEAGARARAMVQAGLGAAERSAELVASLLV